MSELPVTWSRVPLSEIASTAEQRVPADSERFRYIDIASVDRERKVIGDTQELTGANAPTRARKVVRAGDVLVSMTRPNLNAVALVPPELDGQIASTGFEVLRPKGVDPRWLYYLVRSQAFIDEMSSLVQGALYPAVRSKDVRGFIAPLAPLPEQKRIADKLDRLLAAVDTCKARLDAIPDILKRFRQSVLAAAVSGKLTEEWRQAHRRKTGGMSSGGGPPSIAEYDGKQLRALPDGWRWCPFSEVATIDADLRDPLKTPDSPHIAPNHIESETGKLLPFRTIREDRVESSKHHFVPGQILYSKIRPYLAKVTIAPVEGLCSADMYPITAKVNARYLYRWMLTSEFTRFASGREGRTVLPKINQKALAKLPVPVPPEDEQKEIAQRLDMLLNSAERIGAEVAAVHGRVERVAHRLLTEAFRGGFGSEDVAELH